MITFPNAKINLGLNIVARRPDGYHDIETVFLPIDVHDILEIVPAKKQCPTTLTTYGIPILCEPEKNLVMRAVRLMQSRFDVPDVEIHLHKIVPHGAGLGGGSADAAFAMTMINDMFSLNLPKEQLAQLAATLGADCPFFIYNRPMIATGIGDKLSPVDVSLNGKGLYLVKPHAIIPTAEAYAGVTPALPVSSLSLDLSQPIEQWLKTIKNDFEPSVFAHHPELAAIKTSILDSGAIYAAMSGSGSSIFGIFDDVNMAEQMKGKFDCECDFVTSL